MLKLKKLILKLISIKIQIKSFKIVYCDEFKIR